MLNNSSINRFFSSKVFYEIIKNGHSDVYDYVVRRYIDSPEEKTNAVVISEIYSYMRNDNRNEYYYTNTLLNKLLVGIHSVNTTTALSQLRIARHIADFVMINGEGVVYEVKSDLDNLERLTDQIEDYYKAFSKVSVLVSENEYKHTVSTLKRLGTMGDAVGVYVLSSDNTIFDKIVSKSPENYEDRLDYNTLFSIMRKKEYENVIRNRFGDTPSARPVHYYKSCLIEFKKIPITEAKCLVHNELKKRNRIEKEMFERVPMEMKSVVYFGKLINHLPQIESFMEQKFQWR